MGEHNENRGSENSIAAAILVLAKEVKDAARVNRGEAEALYRVELRAASLARKIHLITVALASLDAET
jgi:hypothetical protein